MDLGRAFPGSKHNGRQLAHSKTIVGPESIVGSVASVPLVLSHRRLATNMTVSNTASLIATLADPMVDTIVVTAGHYILSEELSVLRSVSIEAAVPGTVTLKRT